MLDKIREWWRGLFLCDINRPLKYAWLWKVLVSWDKGISVGFYPDYEWCVFQVSVWWGRERR